MVKPYSSKIFKPKFRPLVKTLKKKPSEQVLIKKQDSLLKLAQTFWIRYCYQSSIHGVRYIVEKSLKPFERFLWAIIVVLAVTGMAFVCILLAYRFNDVPLKTVVESTNYPISEISFPAITICDANKVDWRKFELAKKQFISGATKEIEVLFERLVKSFDSFEFGSFEDFREFQNISMKAVDHINLLALNNFLTQECDDLFILNKCWWRNRYISCCDNFGEQRSEYGLGFSFNSAVSSTGISRTINESVYPLRTSGYGEASGLKFAVTLDPKKRIPDSSNTAGVYVIVHNPEEWPQSGYFIPTGTLASILITPKISYALRSTRRIPPEKRGCIFEDEVRSQKHNTLPNLKYLKTNCQENCKQAHTMKYCNCTMEFMFPKGNFRACNFTDLKCLLKYDNALNYLKPFGSNHYFPESEPGMKCDCPSECSLLEYKMQILTSDLSQSEQENDVVIDVHFQDGTVIKYRTDVVYSYLDLLVSFGGIAGLFLGISLLSIAEYVYYMTVGLAVYIESIWKPKQARNVIVHPT